LKAPSGRIVSGSEGCYFKFIHARISDIRHLNDRFVDEGIIFEGQFFLNANSLNCDDSSTKVIIANPIK